MKFFLRKKKKKGGAVKHVQACLSASKDGESSLHHCAENSLHRRFYRSQGAIRHVQVCLCASTDQESSFHHSWSPVKLVQTCLCA